jgi:hypothetical protein
MQIVHSCILFMIALFVFKLARQRTLFRRREYSRIVKLTVTCSVLYLLPALYVGWITYDSSDGLILLLEWLLDSALSVNSGGCPLLISMLIHLQVAIIIFCLNLVSTLLSEAIQKLNRVRSGGRSEYNALELNKLISDVV